LYNLSAAEMIFILFAAPFKCSKYCAVLSFRESDLFSDNSFTREIVSSEYHFSLSFFSQSSISSITS
jgi:hypothetical protein